MQGQLAWDLAETEPPCMESLPVLCMSWACGQALGCVSCLQLLEYLHGLLSDQVLTVLLFFYMNSVILMGILDGDQLQGPQDHVIQTNRSNSVHLEILIQILDTPCSSQASEAVMLAKSGSSPTARPTDPGNCEGFLQTKIQDHTT